MHWIIQKTINFFKKTPENSTALLVEKQDSLAAEVPVSLVYNGIAHTVMMCSPQDLEDFALGFSLAEGIIEKKADIYGIDVVEVCNGIEVQIELSSRQFVALKDYRRTLTGRTGCGICGTEQISQVYKKLPKLDRTFQFNLNLLDGCLAQLQANQTLGKETGATHAAAFFDLSGNLLAIREDVGRHVALDKLINHKDLCWFRAEPAMKWFKNQWLVASSYLLRFLPQQILPSIWLNNTIFLLSALLVLEKRIFILGKSDWF